MDDSIKDRLKGIIERRDVEGKGSAQEREASAARREAEFRALWDSRQEEVVRPAFEEFRKHLSSTYRIASHIRVEEGVGAFKLRGDPNLRFVFGDAPRLGQEGGVSFFEIRCDPRAQTWSTRIEVHDGENVEARSETQPLPLDEISTDWIHEQLAQVLAQSYGQRGDAEETPDGEPAEASADGEAADDEPSENDNPDEDAAEAKDDEEPADDAPERPDTESGDADAQKSADE